MEPPTMDQINAALVTALGGQAPAVAPIPLPYYVPTADEVARMRAGGLLIYYPAALLGEEWLNAAELGLIGANPAAGPRPPAAVAD